ARGVRERGREPVAPEAAEPAIETRDDLERLLGERAQLRRVAPAREDELEARPHRGERDGERHGARPPPVPLSAETTSCSPERSRTSRPPTASAWRGRR